MGLSKSDRERQKLITDKCQSLIEVLLREEDNKYCVDCDAKGPRWASWNLGVFLCIRCAGIHRNLGVHISRVKSVNLDAWTPEHVAHVQRMGNRRAREIYEANLPDDFRRPQTDTALESFIRAKYELKKYISADYVDPGPPPPAFSIEEELKKVKEQKKSKAIPSNIAKIVTDTSNFIKQTRPPDTGNVKSKPSLDLVDVGNIVTPEPSSDKPANKSAIDLLIGDLSSPSEIDVFQTAGQDLISTDNPISKQNPSSSVFGLDLDLTGPAIQPSQPKTTPDGSKTVMTKESILSLYNTSARIGFDPR